MSHCTVEESNCCHLVLQVSQSPPDLLRPQARLRFEEIFSNGARHCSADERTAGDSSSAVLCQAHSQP